MARRRPTSTQVGQTPNDHVSKSIFSPDADKSVKIPPGLEKNLRKRVKTILELNPYLTQVQVPSVIRLAQNELLLDRMNAELDSMGVVIETSSGGVKPNPLIMRITQMSTTICNQERNLAITIPSRKETVSKEEQEAPAKLTVRKSGGARLRIA